MFDALSLAKKIYDLGSANAGLLTALVNTVRGHDAATQRAALDAALAAAEQEAARRMFARKA
jgi:hypothetical protein